MADPKAMWEDEAVASLVCLEKEDATDGGATMAGWTTRAIFGARDRSQGTMDGAIGVIMSK